MREPVNIVWLKRDLRIEDHAALFCARKRGTVIALYIIEPEYWYLPDTSARQWQFIQQSLEPLNKQLGRLGIPLIFFKGDAVMAFSMLAKTLQVASVHSHQETGNLWTYNRDRAVASLLNSLELPWHEHIQHGVFRKLDTRNGWANRWDAMMGEAFAPLPARQEWPTELMGKLPPVFSTTVIEPDLQHTGLTQIQTGGREEGLALLASFLGGRGEHYRKAMSSPLEGADACSRISPHLAYGTLSMRECFHASVEMLQSLDKENPAHKKMRQSIVSFIGRLHWHCHFIQKLETTPAIEWQELHPAYEGMRREIDEELLERWFTGNTGWPFMDACMRSLQATGWINFRMRAMITAVASYHYWQPWQVSGQKLGSLFTDYEPGIHWPQIQMQSGTTGINTVRVYNPVKQGHDQDPDGIFIKRWVPELRDLEGKCLHEPWRLDRWPDGYPVIMMEHMQAAREAREKIWAVRKGKGFRNEAKDILNKHSSRKSLKQPDHRKRKKQPDPDQFSLDL
jgi:deoxyribodipyrimidine photo-lyase